MPSHDTVVEYIGKLPGAAQFGGLETAQQTAYVFDAMETIKAHFGDADITLTDRIIALQALYMVEGDFDEYTRLKAHGVDSYKVKDVTVSFRDGAMNLHPDVHDQVMRLNPHLNRRARVGRLI